MSLNVSEIFYIKSQKGNNGSVQFIFNIKAQKGKNETVSFVVASKACAINKRVNNG